MSEGPNRYVALVAGAIPDPYDPRLRILPWRLDARGLPVYRVRARGVPIPPFLLQLRAIAARYRFVGWDVS